MSIDNENNEEVKEFVRLRPKIQKLTQDLKHPTQDAKQQEKESTQEWQEFRNVLMEIRDDAHTLSSKNKGGGGGTPKTTIPGSHHQA